MRQRAIIRTPYPTLRDAAQTYDVSEAKLRELVARYLPVLEGTASKPLPPSEAMRRGARRKRRMRLHVAARRRGGKSKR